jgi:hypothetical protein
MYNTFLIYQRALPSSNSNLEKQQDGRNEIFHIRFPFVLTGVQYNIKQATTYFTST